MIIDIEEELYSSLPSYFETKQLLKNVCSYSIDNSDVEF